MEFDATSGCDLLASGQRICVVTYYDPARPREAIDRISLLARNTPKGKTMMFDLTREEAYLLACAIRAALDGRA